MAGTFGARRVGQGVGKDRSGVDPESLERGNDQGLDTLAERVGLLKMATHSVRNEAESQHTILDKLGMGFASTHSVLGSASDKFKVVMSNKQNRNITLVIAASVALLLLYWYWKRSG
ncbi:Qc-snare protein, Bet1/mBET1 family [Dunaliella salina]|uniref:Qc-snare protein, Bet1/mBET1 family n=1 Tax=Dunaliella salina TaxID=3046 RepID=A0ABQ7GWA2_DUNSA|nr:Qc-snare protein, Bet1/mBET1 family [Dunaliella salina]|eukprot:KAF5838893.1 Qc-snare protein, Bet1/mBET1 family [Dunaliella salina]